MSTERGRLSQVLARARAEAVKLDLAHAAAYGQALCCGVGSPPLFSSALNESAALDGILSNCDFYISPNGGVTTESTRAATIQAKTIIASRDPTDPATRFSTYVRFFPPPCPPIPPFYATAGEPRLQGKNCPLPNKPDNITLPG